MIPPTSVLKYSGFSRSIIAQPIKMPTNVGGSNRRTCDQSAFRPKNPMAHRSPTTSIGSRTPVDSKAPNTKANSTTCSMLMPGKPDFENPMPVAPTANSAIWSGVRDESIEFCVNRRSYRSVVEIASIYNVSGFTNPTHLPTPVPASNSHPQRQEEPWFVRWMHLFGQSVSSAFG